MPVWMHKVNPVIRESKPIIICKNNDNTKPTPKVALKFIIAAMLDIVNPRFDANILTGMSGSLLFHSLYPKTDNAAIPTTIAYALHQKRTHSVMPIIIALILKVYNIKLLKDRLLSGACTHSCCNERKAIPFATTPNKAVNTKTLRQP